MKIALNLDTTLAAAASNKSRGNSQNSFQASLENALNAVGTTPAAGAGAGAAKTMTHADKVRAAEAADAATLAEFREYMSKSPEQRMIEAILKELGITQEELNAMPPEERAAVENSIAAKIRERLEAQEQKKANELTTKMAHSDNAGLLQLLSL